MADLWGDDDDDAFDADVVEECLMLASQATSSSNSTTIGHLTAPQVQQQAPSQFTFQNSKSAFEFKQPTTAQHATNGGPSFASAPKTTDTQKSDAAGMSFSFLSCFKIWSNA